MTQHPAFFARAPRITLRDPLAALLGMSSSGILTYEYGDAARLAGHSCPTVAGAWLMIRNGLRTLYGTEVAERGAVQVFVRHPREQGTTGVTALIATQVTGAAPETGFSGIGPQHRFARRNLLRFGASIDGVMALRRGDDDRGVVLDLNAGVVPPDPEMLKLFPTVVAGDASAEAVARFGELWQGRVERMLIDHADDPELVRVREWREPR